MKKYALKKSVWEDYPLYCRDIQFREDHVFGKLMGNRTMQQLINEFPDDWEEVLELISTDIVVEKDGRWFNKSKLINTGFSLWHTAYYLTLKGTLIAFNANPTDTIRKLAIPVWRIATESENAAYLRWKEEMKTIENLPAEKEV